MCVGLAGAAWATAVVSKIEEATWVVGDVLCWCNLDNGGIISLDGGGLGRDSHGFLPRDDASRGGR